MFSTQDRQPSRSGLVARLCLEVNEEPFQGSNSRLTAVPGLKPFALLIRSFQDVRKVAEFSSIWAFQVQNRRQQGRGDVFRRLGAYSRLRPDYSSRSRPKKLPDIEPEWDAKFKEFLFANSALVG